MDNWTATNELRFVRRIRGQKEDGFKALNLRILQQKWHLMEYIEGEGFKRTQSEWRDVPVEEESK